SCCRGACLLLTPCWHDCSSTLFWAKALLDVCRYPGICGDTACASQSSAASIGLEPRAAGGRRGDRGRPVCRLCHHRFAHPASYGPIPSRASTLISGGMLI